MARLGEGQGPAIARPLRPGRFSQAAAVDRADEILPEAPELDARIRYVGSEIVHYFNSANITGTTLSDLGPIYWDRWADVGRQVRQARGPLCFQGAPFLVGKAHVNLEMLVLPLSKTGEGVDFLILAFSRL